jgi:membrane-bound lytic murein transglycosylase D
MRLFCLTLLLLSSICAGLGQGSSDTMTFDDVIDSAQQWAQDNLDKDALRVLSSADQERVRQLLADVQKQLQGEYVIDLATLKEAAKDVLPLLESYDETVPYAVWLKTRLDYLDVADQFRLIIPPPKTEPGKPPKIAPNPTPQKEREVWVTKLSERPMPKSAQPYISQLKPIFASEKVPPELVWLAEVESSFDPRARSPAGAAGLFQLMPATAGRYGLKTGWLWDDRLKPEPSARAAARYLHYLYNRFGDWRLALAAYNAGEGTVQELLTREKTHSYNAIATHLPAETQMYVPKLEATLLRREGLKLTDLRVPASDSRK